MKNNLVRIKSLSQQVRWQLTLLGFGLFLASLVLLSLFSFHAIETTTNYLVKLEAESIVRKALEQPDSPLPMNDTEGAYRSWSDIPSLIRRLFTTGANVDTAPPVSDEVLEAVRSGEGGKQEYFYLLHHYDEKFGDLFLLSRHDIEDIEMVAFRLFLATLQQSFWSALIIFVLLFFLIRWLIRRTSEPLVLLSRWAADLGERPEQPLNTDFPIQELNQLATQLREGVDKIETYNRREQEFLRYTSHELRTPLGIIQASLDTLALQTDNRTVRRALKASENVRQLSSALLWLAQPSDRTVDKSSVNLSVVVPQIIEDHRYLIRDKAVQTEISQSVKSLVIERDLFGIVFSNLVRNAFQYCSSGTIHINISEQRLIINNPYDHAQNTESKTLVQSFGIGLQLVQRICQKLNWQFEFTEVTEQVSVCITWDSIQKSMN